jgi:hypothetical protein
MRALGVGSPSTLSFFLLATTAAGVTTYSDSTAALNTNYSYQIVSVGKGGNGLSSPLTLSINTANTGPAMYASPLTPGSGGTSAAMRPILDGIGYAF